VGVVENRESCDCTGCVGCGCCVVLNCGIAKKDLAAERKKEKQKKIAREMTKLVATSVAVLTIIYYIIKIIFITTVFYHDGKEAKKIKKQIKQKLKVVQSLFEEKRKRGLA
jgi:hypothetical protein